MVSSPKTNPKESEINKDIAKNYYSQPKPIKVNIIKNNNNVPNENNIEIKNEQNKELNINKEIKKEENKTSKLSPKKIFSYNQKQINDNAPKKSIGFSNEKIKNFINMINKSESNSKANKNNNNLSQKWNKITEIKNIKRNII